MTHFRAVRKFLVLTSIHLYQGFMSVFVVLIFIYMMIITKKLSVAKLSAQN